jgi:hypothetical protein
MGVGRHVILKRGCLGPGLAVGLSPSTPIQPYAAHMHHDTMASCSPHSTPTSPKSALR